MASAKDLETFVERVGAVAESMVDSYFVCDADRTVVAHNEVFVALVGDAQPVGKKCYDLMRLTICQSACVANHCLDEQRIIKLDNVGGEPAQRKRAFNLTGTPIFSDTGEPLGALEIQHDITELSELQDKYQATLKQHGQELGEVEGELSRRTTELIDAHRVIRQTRLELLEYKKGTLP